MDCSSGTFPVNLKNIHANQIVHDTDIPEKNNTIIDGRTHGNIPHMGPKSQHKS